MKRTWIASLAVVALAASVSFTAQGGKKPVAFGALEGMETADVKAKAQAWLKDAGKTDPATLQNFQAIWGDENRSALDRLADTFGLGNEQAAKLMAEARNPFVPAPTAVPAVLKDEKLPVFFRANLALAYARALAARTVHDEALATLKLFQPEQVVAPGAYLFTRAICEHATLQREDATRTIVRLIEDGVGTPERYKTVSALMLLDMQTWKAKDLAAIARKMKVVEDRLIIARGGPQTQKIQKEIIDRLDELIKEEENKAKQQQGDPKDPKDGDPKPGDPNGGSCPNGGQPGNQPGQQPGQQPGDPNNPLPDSQIGGQTGKGTVDTAKIKKYTEGWGKMTPREQAKAIQDVTRGMSPKHREAIENYFRNLATPPPEIRSGSGGSQP